MKRILPLLLLFALPVYATVPSDSAQYAGPYACDGADTTFNFSFGLDDDDDLQVIKITVSTGAELVLTKTTDYTIASANANDGLDLSSGGTVNTRSAYSSSYQIFLRRNTVKSQPTNIDDDDVEAALDKLTYIIQDIAETVGRCLKIPPSETGDTVQFSPVAGTGAGYAYRAAGGGWSLVSDVSIGAVLDANFWDTAIPEYGTVGGGDPCTVYFVGNELYWEGPDGVVKYLSELLNEDNFATAIAAGATSDLIPPSQHSVYNWVRTGTITMTNKTLTSPAINTGTLTSPVINTGVSGTAIDTDGTLAANSDTKLASQKAVKTYAAAQVDAHRFTASGVTVFNGTMTASSTFQDLDLSAIVGSNIALVNLLVSSNGVGHYTVKPKGVGGTYAQHTNNASDLADNGRSGATAFEGGGTEYDVKTTCTSSAGLLEQAYSDNSDTITVVLLNYLK